MIGPVGQYIRDRERAKESHKELTTREIERYTSLIDPNRDPLRGQRNNQNYLGETGLDVIGARPLLPPQRPNPSRPKIANDIFNGPYKGPDDLDNYSGETSYMRIMFRRLYASIPELQSAIDGKIDAIASAPVSVQPADRTKKIDREMAEFFNWTIDESEDGWDGLMRAALIGYFIDGWAVLEPTFGGQDHPKFGAATGLLYTRAIDTAYLKLEIDQYRRLQGIVNLRRGLEVYDPEQAMVFTNRAWYSNPFGNSDVRPVYQSCLMIEDAYRAWDIALKLFSVPYVHGKVKNPNQRTEMEKALKFLRGAGYIVTGEEDQVELLSLTGATGFDAFQKNIEAKSQRIFLSVRGAYLPFLEGKGGGERRGDTSVHQNASDAKVSMATKSIERVIRRGLAKRITEFNFPEAGVPLVKIGGRDMESGKTFVDLVASAQSVGAKVSAKQFHEESGISPPEDENDILSPQSPTGDPNAEQTAPDGPPSVPQEQPKETPAIPAAAMLDTPPGRGTVAGVPPAPATPNASPFSAEHAKDFATYFAADQYGRYPGEIHEQFGMTVPDFATRTKMRRRQIVSKNSPPRWVWMSAAKDVGEKDMANAVRSLIAELA